MTAITRRERRQAERRGERHEQDLADHDADQRAEQRRAHRGQRAEQQRQQQDRDGDADELPDRRLLLGREVDEHAARGELDAVALRRLARGQQLLAVGLLDVGRIGAVADVDRRQAAVGRDGAALGERVGDLGDAGQLLDLGQRALDRGARAGVGDLALRDAEDERRISAGERGRVRLEEVDRLLGLGAGRREVVDGLTTRSGGDADRTTRTPRAANRPRTQWCVRLRARRARSSDI